MKGVCGVQVFRFIVLALAAILQCGCNTTQDADYVRSENDTNIKKVGSAYQLYSSRYGYIGPKSKEELVRFLVDNESIVSNLKMMGLDRERIDDYFISENDGEEFTFRWGVFVNPDLERAREPLVFEKTGSNGVRQVLLANRKLLEVRDEAKYQQLLSGKVGREDGKSKAELSEEVETVN